MPIDVNNLMERIQKQRAARGSGIVEPVPLKGAPAGSTTHQGPTRKRPTGSRSVPKQNQSRSVLLSRIYKIPLLGPLARIATGVINLPRIIQNIYALQDQVRLEATTTRHLVAQAQSVGERRVADLTAKLAEFERVSKHLIEQARSQAEAAATDVRLAGPAIETLTARQASLMQSIDEVADIRAVVVRLLSDRRATREVSTSILQNGQADRVDPPHAGGSSALTHLHLARRPKGAVQTGADVLARLRDISEDEEAQKQTAAAIRPDNPITSELLTEMKLRFLEERIADLELARAPSRRFTLEPKLGDPRGELSYFLASKNLMSVALVGASLGSGSASMFEQVAVRNSKLQCLMRGSEAAEIAVEFFNALSQLPAAVTTDVQAVVVGPVMERLTKTERALALRILGDELRDDVLIALQVGSGFWLSQSPDRAESALLEGAPLGSLHTAGPAIAEIIQELTAAGFRVERHVSSIDEPELSASAGSLVIVSRHNG